MKTKVFALWYEPLLGLQGYICGVIQHEGALIPVGICSAEKWWGGRADSLRRGWITPACLSAKAKEELSPKEFARWNPVPHLLQLKVPHQTLNRFRYMEYLVAYTIWPAGHSMAYEVASTEADHEFVPGCVPKAVLKEFPTAHWDRLQTTYANLSPRMKKSWGINKARIATIHAQF